MANAGPQNDLGDVNWWSMVLVVCVAQYTELCNSMLVTDQEAWR